MNVDIKAHITGTVWKIEVEVGEEVEEEDVVVILESMKMEMPVEAPADGTITEILIKEGDAVQEGQPLARMDED
ncbi:MAG: biotin/lipoyl-binding carrier protein [Myxococcota bacterium]|nr:biotin/lipoyl-binding carrier protein [Myxococcota bacterium]